MTQSRPLTASFSSTFNIFNQPGQAKLSNGSVSWLIQIRIFDEGAELEGENKRETGEVEGWRGYFTPLEGLMGVG
jgi:hypothetical protein